MANQANQVGYASAAPTDTTQYWQTGDIVLNNGTLTAVSYVYGWQCALGGYPGTWQALMTAPQLVATTTATTGTFAANTRLQLLNAAAGTYSLPNVLSYPAGAQLTVYNVANVNATLTPLAANNYQSTSVAAITLTQAQVVTLISGGGTTWYKVA